MSTTEDKNEATFYQLVGLQIDKVFIANDKTSIILKVGNRYFEISHPQDCCEFVFFQHVNQIEYLIGSTISSIKFLEYKETTGSPVSGEDNSCLTNMGFEFTTEKGTTTFENRLESNGCYGGELVCDEALKENWNCLAVKFNCSHNELTRTLVWKPNKTSKPKTDIVTYPILDKDF